MAVALADNLLGPFAVLAFIALMGVIQIIYADTFVKQRRRSMKRWGFSCQQIDRFLGPRAQAVIGFRIGGALLITISLALAVLLFLRS